MNTFTHLLANPTARPPEEVQAEARCQFADRVAQSKLCQRRPDSSVLSGKQIVLGVATYSLPELQLLDEVNNRYADWSPLGFRIEVFNVLQCQTQQDFARYIPGLTTDLFQTPVVAIWTDQQLNTIKTGEHAVRLALKHVGVL